MIQSENPPSLCPRCVHFKMRTWASCAIGNYSIEGPVARGIQRWLQAQTDESSWTFTGPCPEFSYNDSSDYLMSPSDQQALRKLLRR